MSLVSQTLTEERLTDLGVFAMVRLQQHHQTLPSAWPIFLSLPDPDPSSPEMA